MTLENAIKQLENSVYAATELFECLEFEGKIIGNGHHLRQQVSAQAAKILAQAWREATPPKWSVVTESQHEAKV